MSQLAILGGEPAFPNGVPFVRPPTPPLARVMELLEPSWDRGMLTNGPLVRRLETEAAELLDVEHVVAVSSCTTGLMLALRALVDSGDVLLPSFTFSASAHAIAWNGTRPRFTECDPATFQIDLADAGTRTTGMRAVLATHVFGAPCDAEGVEKLASRSDAPVVFDAAHAFGATRGGVGVARFGDASVFSLTPTKPVVAGEGGLVATMRADVAEHIRLGRDYGNPGNYDTQFVGLNGRMSEMHAAVAVASLECRPAMHARRVETAGRYARAFSSIPGIRTQHIDAGDTSTWKDFTIAVDADKFGTNRDALQSALAAEGVDTRCYFDPPVHRQTAYAGLGSPALPVTDALSASVLSLPVYPALSANSVERIVELVEAVRQHADQVGETSLS